MSVALAISALLACSEPAEPTAVPALQPLSEPAPLKVVGLYPNPQERPFPGETLCDYSRDVPRYAARFDQRYRESGVTGVTYAINWRLVDVDEHQEPNLSELQFLETPVDHVYLNFSSVWSERLDTPAFLGPDPFDPELPRGTSGSPLGRTIARGKRFLRAFVAQRPRLAARVAWLALGNEIDLYRARFDSRVNHDVGFFKPGGTTTRSYRGYLRFVRELGVLARELMPGVQVTVSMNSFAYLDPGLSNAVWKLDRATDMTSVTYHADSSGMARPFDETLQQLTRRLGSRKLALQEVGFMAPPEDEQRQVEFLDQVFASWRAAGEQVPYLGLFSVHDWHFETKPCVAGLANLCDFCDPSCRPCGSGNDGQAHAVRWAGFLRSDGTPKPAWSRLREHLSAGAPPRVGRAVSER